jgi:Fe2+ or Zn2+ uptake regulation protein
MSEATDLLQNKLRQNGFSMTRPRQLVFDSLKDKDPQTMHQIIETCQRQIDRASVYRTVALFEDLDIVERLQIGWKYKLELSDQFQEHHHHLSCKTCGQLFPLPEDAALEARLQAMTKSVNFKAESHQIEVYGTCAKCSAANIGLQAREQ